MTASLSASSVHASPQDFDIPRLLLLLQRQRDLYTQLRGLSADQSDHVQRGSAEALLGILAQRQRLIDELAAINEELGPYRQSWGRVWQQVPQAQQPQVNALLAELDGLLKGIIDQDERDRRQLQAAKQQVGHELKKMSAGNNAVGAYNRRTAGVAYAATNPRFTDNKV
jgi:hypothetical protein